MLIDDDSEVQSFSKGGIDHLQKGFPLLKRLYHPPQYDAGTSYHKIQKPGNKNYLCARISRDLPGHTGYLTFATLLPSLDVK